MNTNPTQWITTTGTLTTHWGQQRVMQQPDWIAETVEHWRLSKPDEPNHPHHNIKHGTQISRTRTPNNMWLRTVHWTNTK